DAKPSLADDDVIVSFDGKPVANVEALVAETGLTSGRKGPVRALVTFERRGERLLTVVEVGRPVLEDPGLEARKAWVPVNVQVLTRDLAEKLGVASQSGVRVTRVLR